MTIGPHRPGFYVSVLAAGFVLGGFLSALLDRFLPQGPAKEFFTWTVNPSIGPFHVNLLVVNMTLGPLGVQVSLLALVGVALAYLVARSLF
ncbi:MAG: DUF4321 domain-containing protein [Gemmatimonadetes bacterium]|nr:DUF4321 domain-containing protein [Gemmatimonadota bacterium]